MIIHYFSPEIAEKCGVNAAIIFQNLLFWIQHNIANNNNYYDGNYWTYNSNKAFKEIFYYLTESQIRTALKILQEKELIIIGNYNANRYDRTNWYAIKNIDEYLYKNAIAINNKSICEISQMENHNLSNGNENLNNCIITNNKPDIKTNNKQDKNFAQCAALDFSFLENSPFKESFLNWIDYKGKKTYKTQKTLLIAFEHLKQMANNNPKTAAAIVNQSIANNWKGLFELKNHNQTTENQKIVNGRFIASPENMRKMDYSITEF